MKTYFIPSELEGDILPAIKKAKEHLKGVVGIVTTAQLIGRIGEIESFLKQEGFEVVVCGQVLGCNQYNITEHQDKVDTFLYVGSGEFHPLGIALKTDKRFICVNPDTSTVKRYDAKKLEQYRKRIKGALLKFYSANKVGIIISTKSGQSFFKKALRLEEEYPDKIFYLFAAPTLNFTELENFPFVECWVNTMCPRIMDDYDKFLVPVINLSDIHKQGKIL